MSITRTDVNIKNKSTTLALGISSKPQNKAI